MPDDPRLDDLLDRYQELLEEGKPPNLDDLCRDCSELRPEVERRISQLNRMGKILGDSSSPELPQLSLSDDKTWVNQASREAAPVEIPAPPGYEVLEPLGEGGMGIVYKALQIGLNRLVALKMILAGTRARAVDLARFREEAQAIASLRHPNIVQVYETGEYRNQPFFSLEFCPGGPLSRTLNGEPQSPGVAAAMAEVLARAMHYAHTRGIFHRDLKPGNILLSTEGGPADSESSTLNGETALAGHAESILHTPHSVLKITDFGLAKRVDDSSDKTQDGSVIGTPSYMAPEQAFGHTKAIGPATDIHALGAILYEFLTGRPPFKGSTVHETLEQVRYRNPVPVRDLQPKVPPDLETICLKCLEKEQKKRYSSAEALAEDLHSYRLNRSIKARPIGQLSRAWRWCRREPRTAGMAAALAILGLALSSMLARYATRLETAEELIKEHEAAMTASLNMQRLTEETTEAQRYDAELNSAQHLHGEAPLGWTWEARKHIAAAATSSSARRDPAVLRSELAATHFALDLRFERDIVDHMAIGAVAFAADGRIAVAPQLISIIASRFVLVFDPRTQRELRLPFSTDSVSDRSTAMAFTPDGKWLFLALRGGLVFRWRLPAGGEPVRTSWEAHAKGAVEALAISPDSKWLYTGGEDGLVKRWAVDGDARPDRVWPPPGNANGHIRGLAYWPGPQNALVVFGSTGFRVLDPDALTELATIKAPTLAGSDGKFAADPQHALVAVSRGGELELAQWNAETCFPGPKLRDLRLEAEDSAHPKDIDTLIFHPSGAWLVSASPNDGQVKFWCASSGNLRLSVPFADARIVAFSDDGRWAVIGGDHKLSLYEVSGTASQCPISSRGMVIRAIGLTGDGQLATIASRHPTRDSDRGATVATIWDRSGRPLENVVEQITKEVIASERVVSSLDGNSTIFLSGDGRLVSREAPGKQKAIKLGRIQDLAIDSAGHYWTIENNQTLVLRTKGLEREGRAITLNRSWAGRKDLACVHAGREHVVVGCTNGYLRILQLDGKPIRECACFDEKKSEFLIERSTTINAVDISRDGGLAAAGTDAGRLWLYRLPGGEKVCDWTAHAGRVTAVAFDPSGDWLATGGQDAAISLWRRTGERYEHYLTMKRSGSAAVRQLLYSTDGQYLWVIHEKETMVRAWNLLRLKEEFATTGLDR